MLNTSESWVAVSIVHSETHTANKSSSYRLQAVLTRVISDSKWQDLRIEGDWSKKLKIDSKSLWQGFYQSISPSSKKTITTTWQWCLAKEIHLTQTCPRHWRGTLPPNKNYCTECCLWLYVCMADLCYLRFYLSILLSNIEFLVHMNVFPRLWLYV